MKKINYLLILTICIFAYTNLNAYQFDFVTVRDVVSKVRKTFNQLETLQANFTVISKKAGKTTRQNGRIKYKSSDRLLVQFYNGQKIISNGKMMWIYIPQLNVVAEQDLNSNKGFFGSAKSGLKRLFSKYHYKFASKQQPEETKKGKFYTLLLRQKESRSGFRSIKLWISEKFIITKAQGKSSTGKNVEIIFSKIKKNSAIKNGVFKFDIPSRARVIKNPMMSEVK